MSKNKATVPQARDALDKFKMEAAREVGVNLKSGYNGDLSSKEAGSVGGQMVKNICPVRTLTYMRADRREMSHLKAYTYEVTFVV